MRSKTASERLRAAVATGAYREAERLLDVYRGEVEACWHATTSAEERRAISTEVMGLLEWARIAMLAARSHAQGRLIQFTRRNAYESAGVKTIDQLQLDA